MFGPILEWLKRKWRFDAPAQDLLNAWRLTFTGAQGKIVLHDLLDKFYCAVYRGNDPIELARHNGQREVIQAILENLDMAEHPEKYKLDIKFTKTEGFDARNGNDRP